MHYTHGHFFQKLCWLVLFLAFWQFSVFAFAEGSAQISSDIHGLNQPIYEYNVSSGLLSSDFHPLYIILDNASDVVNVSLCAEDHTGGGQDDFHFEVWATTVDTDGKYVSSGASAIYVSPTLTGSTEAAACTFTASTSSLNPPASYRWAPNDDGVGAGIYEIRLINEDFNDEFDLFDISVTPDKVTNPDPSDAAGRLFAYNWAFNAGNYLSAQSTDADYYVLVPGGTVGTNYVWLLDLQEFAGFVYDIIANALGVIETSSGDNIGFSVPFTGYTLTELYPIYLGYPVNADPEPVTPPTISNYRFLDSDGIDQTISPNVDSVQESGTFSFDSNIPGTAQLIIDANQDGIFGNTVAGTDDIYLYTLVSDTVTNSITWDGTDNDGNVLPDGSYNAQLQVRIGEYHFVAGDAETSGGGSNDGLTIYRATELGLFSTPVYWDDLTGFDPDKAGNGGNILPSGENSVVGASSGNFRHTWGNFTSNSFGNTAWVDTYTYGLSSFTTTPASINTTGTDDPANIGVAKSASLSGNEVSFNFYLENFSGIDVSNLSLTDNLDDVFGAGNYTIDSSSIVSMGTGSSLTLNGGFTGTPSGSTELLSGSNTLAAFETAQIELVVTITTVTDQGFGLGLYYNSATLSGDFTPSGGGATQTVTDDSTLGTDPDVDSTASDTTTPDGGVGANDNNNTPADNSTPTPIDLTLYDYGDAPDTGVGTSTGNYQSLRLDGGPRHETGSGIYLGGAVSSDDDAFVDGIDDNNDASDDSDDGVSLAGTSLQAQSLARNETYSLSVSTAGSGSLNAWIDWNANGDFTDSGEQIAINLTPTAGTISISVTVPAAAVIGETYARFRYSSTAGLNSTGDASDGEVEDYQVSVIYQYDYGDAPDTTSATGSLDYETTEADNGAFHRYNPNLRLGSLLDTDAGTLQDLTALADDNDESNDEDAVSYFPTLVSGDTGYNLNVDVNNTTGSPAYLRGWIDLNQDGDFIDSGEQSTVIPIPTGTTGITNLSWSFTSPTAGNTYVRIRLSDNATPSPVGTGGYGEVEDYRITVLSGSFVCPPGTLLESVTGYVLSEEASVGNVLNSSFAFGAPLAAGSSVFYTTNSAIVYFGGVLTLDLEKLVPEGAAITLALANYNGNTSTVTVDSSSDNSNWFGSVTYAPSTSPSNTSEYLIYTVPSSGNGARYLRFTSAADSLVHIDGLIYTEACGSFDFGDAPDSYGDAYHDQNVNSFYLGALSPDSESESQNTANGSTDGTGDDNNGTNDEDGVTLPDFHLGQTAEITLSVEGSGPYLNAWIDWNDDGDFDDSGEQIATGLQDNAFGDSNLSTGTIVLTPTVPVSAVAGTSYARFRWSSTETLASAGFATDGEVEDYEITLINPDYGDAPNSYGDAYHSLEDSDLYLGSVAPDGEAMSQNTLNGGIDGTGDDANGDDEDSISTFPPLLTTLSTYTIPFADINLNNSTGSPATLYAFIDFNDDGDFSDTGESASATVSAGASNPDTDLTFTGFSMATLTGISYLRLRLSSDSGLLATGSASDGEVEDFPLTLETPTGVSSCVSAATTFNTLGYAYNTALQGFLPLSFYSGTMNFTASLTGSAAWAAGIQLKTDGSVGDHIFVQPNNAASYQLGTNTATYVFTFPTPVEDLSVVLGGLNNDDGTSISATYLGETVEITATNFTSLSTGMSVSDTDTNGEDDTVVSTSTLGGTSVTSNTYTLTITEPIDTLTVVTGKNDADTGNVTLGFQSFSYCLADPVSSDYGDALDSYGDAWHVVPSTLTHYLGGSVDTESQTQNTANGGTDGTGDDTDSNDDDDGVSFPSLVRNTTQTLSVNVTGSGYLNAWIDWDNDGNFTDPGEQIATDYQDGGVNDTNATAGQLNFTVTVPSDASLNPSYARFRWSKTQGLGSTGISTNGEVEDHIVTVLAAEDFGDAPGYPAASHNLGSGLSLGSNVDQDSANYGDGTDDNGDASDDDTEGSTPNDEDGVAVPSFVPGLSASITVNVTGAGVLTAWIDWDGNGSFTDSGEQVAFDLADGGVYDTNAAAGQITFDVTAPSTATSGTSYARFRFSSDTSLSPSGSASDGEVEDYEVTIAAPLNSCFTDYINNTTSPSDEAFWLFEGNLNDSSGNAHNAQNAPTVSYSSDTPSGIGQSVNFSAGGVQYSASTTPISSSFMNAAFNDISFGVWLKPDDSTPTSNQLIIDEGGGTNGYALILMTTGDIRLDIREGDAISELTTSFAFPNDGGWHHIAMTYDNGTVVLYLDGVAQTTLVTTFDQMTQHSSDGGLAEVDGGASTSVSTTVYQGLMDESFMLREALISATNLYNYVDCIIPQSTDFGDAPASYGDAAHSVSGSPSIYLGATAPDTESGSQYSADANADGSEDDALSSFPNLYEDETNYTLTLSCTGSGAIAGWIDFDGINGFNSVERATSTCSSGTATLSWSSISGLSAGDTFLRLRTASSATELLSPTGSASDGEVEDYLLTVQTAPIVTAVPTTCGTGSAYVQTFGTGASYTTTLPTGVRTSFAPYSDGDANLTLPDGEYVLLANPSTPDAIDNFGGGFDNIWHHDPDHTGDTNGYMMLVNGDSSAGDIFRQTFDGLTIGETYSLTVYAANVFLSEFGPGNILPNMTVSAEPVGGGSSTSINTGDLAKTSDATGLVWLEFSVSFTATTTRYDFVVTDNTSSGGGNDFALDDMTVTLNCPGTDLRLVKTVDTTLAAIVSDADSSGNVSPGDTITFELELENLGPIDATSTITVTDTLPAGYTYVMDSMSGGIFQNDSDPTNLVWTISSLADKSSELLSFRAVVEEGASLTASDYENSASLSTATPDTNNSNDSSSVTPDILRIIKYICNESAQGDGSCDVVGGSAANSGGDFSNSANGSPGDVLIYRIEYENFATTIDSFMFSDDVPTHTTLLENAYGAAGEAEIICHANAVETSVQPDLGVINPVTADIITLCNGNILPGEMGAVSFKAVIR